MTTLGVNSDLQLETEPETPWKPKSQVAILDCLEAIRVALIFIEYAPESDIDDYFAWWHRLVRSRPNKIDQLKLHWENTSWRIALALRKKTPFKDIAKEIMNDNQLLQEAMNAEIPPERPTKTHRGLDLPWTDQQRGGKGKGKGKSWSKQQRWGDKSEHKGNSKSGGKGRYQHQFDRQWQGKGRHQDDERQPWRHSEADRRRYGQDNKWKQWQQPHRDQRDHE